MLLKDGMSQERHRKYKAKPNGNSRTEKNTSTKMKNLPKGLNNGIEMSEKVPVKLR